MNVVHDDDDDIIDEIDERIRRLLTVSVNVINDHYIIDDHRSHTQRQLIGNAGGGGQGYSRMLAF